MNMKKPIVPFGGTKTLKLLAKAKAYVTRQGKVGNDWQAAVNDILNDPFFSALFSGLSEVDRDDLLSDISFGVDD